MSVKGCFSYENPAINGFNIGSNLQVRVEPVNISIAKVYVTDDQGNPQPLEHSVVKLRSRDGTNIPPYKNGFLIVWLDDYILSVAGVDKLWFNNQKQQLFEAAAGVTHFVI
eukprot:Colp12_sorted_trinity150504_noHs@3187